MRKFLGIGDPVVPTNYPAELVRMLGERGHRELDVLEGTGVEPAMLRSPKARISYKQLRALIQSGLARSHDPALGLTVGSRLVMGRWGPLGYAILNARDVGQALELVTRYGVLIVPHVEFTLLREADEVRLQVAQFIRLGSLRCFASEAVVAAVLAQLRLVSSQPLPVRCVRFDYPAPGHSDRYAEVLDCPVEFGADTLEVVLDASCWQTPLKFACAAGAAVAEQQCAVELDATQERKSVVSQVRHLLRNREEGFPDVRTAARSLRTSERSLRRALHESGTSYQALIDETRRELAMDYLQSTRVPVEDIARMAGFADGRSFRRAFKRWTGMTPGEARRCA